jgi:hypothetical protein
MLGTLARVGAAKSVRARAAGRLAFGRKIGFEIGFATAPCVDIIGYIGFDLSISFLSKPGPVLL